MKKLKSAKKITLATYKRFALRHQNELYVKNLSSFNGMIDMVDKVDNPRWQKTKLSEDSRREDEFVKGAWTVGSSRDSFSLYEDDEYVGIEIYNCCGSDIVAIKK